MMGVKRKTGLRRETRPRIVDDWVNHPPGGAMLWCEPTPLPPADAIPADEATGEDGPPSRHGGANESPAPKRPFRPLGSSIPDDHSF